MVIDTHYHPTLFRQVCPNEEVAEKRRKDLGYYKYPIIDPPLLKSMLRSSGVDACFLLPYDYRSSGGDYISNQAIKEIADAAPDMFFPFASVDPNLPDAPHDLEVAFGQLHLRGLKLHLGRLKLYPNDPKVSSLLDICQAYNKPVIFHAGQSWQPASEMTYTMPIHFEPIIKDYPNLRICLAHMGFPWIRETLTLLSKYPNCYTDTALLYFDSAREFFEHIFTHEIPLTWYERSLRHQILFGSNMPRWEQMRMLDAIRKVGFRQDTLDLFLHTNALEFLGEEEVKWLS